MERLPPWLKRWGVVGGVGMGSVAVITLLLWDDAPSAPRDRRQVTTVFTDTQTATPTLEGLYQDFERMRAEFTEVLTGLERQQSLDEAWREELADKLDRSLAALADTATSTRSAELARRRREMAEELARLEGEEVPAEPDALFPELDEAPPEDTPGPMAALPPVEDPLWDAAAPVARVPAGDDLPPEPPSGPAPGDLSPDSVFRAERPRAGPPPAPTGVEGDRPRVAAGAIRVVRAETPPAPPARPAPSMFLPAGTVVNGVLLTGLLAETSGGDPGPVLVRVSEFGFMPGDFDVDMESCFVILAARGNRSAERVEMRAETLSCVVRGRRLDVREVYEAPLDATVYGSDGLLGVSARLVEKRGQLVRNAFLSGLLSEIGRALGGSNSISIGLDDDDQLALENVGRSAGRSVLAGTGRALEQLAEFYIREAEKMFPVLEVQGGREVSVMLTRSVALERVQEIEG
mgnify:CR=1 FL=1